MQLYRFSPISNESQLQEVINYLHSECHRLLKEVLNESLPVAGNIGVFTHYPEEYMKLTQLRDIICEEGSTQNQKYYRLKSPITITSDTGSEAKYSHLYIRRPDPYRHHVGDIDFSLGPTRYDELKTKLQTEGAQEHMRIYPKDTLDMIEVHHPDSDVLVYITPERIDN